ncbi:VOC family protein [Fulvimarina sp. MAC8]|uniref:VOC family protein n=1 Tax=Fulvimarina sp. MAC8 TaxID=3162874 RepID=UPI0032EDDBFF
MRAPAAMALAHNVREEGEVAPSMERLVAAGGTTLRPADAPPHGGLRGYVADPDGNVWEVAVNPAWLIGEDGFVTFAAG